jgi:hypothetical protein
MRPINASAFAQLSNKLSAHDQSALSAAVLSRAIKSRMGLTSRAYPAASS